MYQPGLKALGHRGRQVEIASVGNRRVSFDLLLTSIIMRAGFWRRHAPPRRDCICGFLFT